MFSRRIKGIVENIWKMSRNSRIYRRNQYQKVPEEEEKTTETISSKVT